MKKHWILLASALLLTFACIGCSDSDVVAPDTGGSSDKVGDTTLRTVRLYGNIFKQDGTPADPGTEVRIWLRDGLFWPYKEYAITYTYDELGAYEKSDAVIANNQYVRVAALGGYTIDKHEGGASLYIAVTGDSNSGGHFDPNNPDGGGGD